MKPLAKGDLAPPVTAQAHNGETFSLADCRGRDVVVLYFYPRDNTPTCTAQACAFRDAYEEFREAGAVVVGVSSDSLDRHRQFAERQRLPYLLLSDSDGSIRRAFGVPDTWGLIPQRVTFVIDKQGVVRHTFSALFKADRHVREARQIIEQLNAEEAKK